MLYYIEYVSPSQKAILKTGDEPIEEDTWIFKFYQENLKRKSISFNNSSFRSIQTYKGKT